MTTRVVIVGIEQYEESSFDVQAPAANAVAVARWALDSGIAAADVFLFVSSLDPAQMAALTTMGLRNRGTRRDDIETVLRKELPDAAPGSNLLFYWSGHGMADGSGQRIFFCSDYSEKLTDRVFNATLFFRELRGDAYAGYRNQLALADVCGTNSPIPVRPAAYQPGPVRKRNQLIYYATREGGFAQATGKEGAFTQVVIEVLAGSKGFPDFASFRQRLDEALHAADLPRFVIDGRAEDAEWQDRSGLAAMTPDAIARSLVELLAGLGVMASTAQPSFRATVSTLRNPRLLAAQTLTDMVTELSGLRDPVDGAPHGLVQFVLRLCQSQPQHQEELAAWLAARAAKSAVHDETERLTSEDERSALIIDIRSNPRGELVDLTPMLRSLDQTQPRGPRLERVATPSWEAVDQAMQAILRRLDEEGFHDIEIHFIVDTWVFDLPFHRLKGLIMESLGQEFGVLLHHRIRVAPSSTHKRAWQGRARAVSCKVPADLGWTRCSQHQSLPLEANLCLATWLPDAIGKQKLHTLVMMGFPFVYWPHSETEPDAEQDLTQIVRNLGALSAMPDGIRAKRLAELVSSGSLLWDDADFNPYGE